ncbi:AAA family ATPase [Mycolicibacterium pulveris]|uniref:AAA family ATPase n=1 Tax=Mycolicibacterium pulveris TaxID=36813 RepID=A0A7I7UPV8_MYCPV|nr:AAA family ATPase [Mycolicibacterium pulveris]MCV6982988.1 AAA family ATPase [Mycolicibacterium pulveris]BBY82851.1 hypothetical protein MPUL_40090 [Mycolicibacterium pulveris]
MTGKDRSVKLVPATDVTDDVPVWAWTYGGKGRIQLGTLALFAGRPGAGKSTAARWFAAAVSNGTLAGCWEGRPQNVAYIAPAEESVKYIVKPGLRAAGAAMNRIFFPEVRCDGMQVRLLSVDDEDRLTECFVAHDIKLIVVDPLMDTISAKADINRNNEVRAALQPWMRMADLLEGCILGVAHLKKMPGDDIVAGINASSAFGEVARAVFGFVKDDESPDDRIMSQAKNSTGEEDLALRYRIETCSVITDSGSTGVVGRFAITGNSDRTAGDVLRNASDDRHACRKWLKTHLVDHGKTASAEVKQFGEAQGFSTSAIDRAARLLNVTVTSAGFPRKTYWSFSTPTKVGATDVTDVTDATCAEGTPSASVVDAVTSETSVTSVQFGDPRDGDAVKQTA